MDRHNLDGIIVAGDYTGGPHSNETLQLLRGLDRWMIRGNSDDNLIRYDTGVAPDSWKTSKQWALTRWTLHQLEKDNLDYLKSLPNQLVVEFHDKPPIRVVHGSHRDPSESLFPHIDPGIIEGIFNEVIEPVFICGHTHISWKHERDDRLALNPGAVCGPLNGFVGSEYAILSWENDRWHAELHQVCYDMDLIRIDFTESGLLAEGGALAKAFLRSIETGLNIAEDFLSYAYKLSENAGYHGYEVVPDHIWDQADRTFFVNNY
jgi:predicted phosphodiesterase